MSSPDYILSWKKWFTAVLLENINPRNMNWTKYFGKYMTNTGLFLAFATRNRRGLNLILHWNVLVLLTTQSLYQVSTTCIFWFACPLRNLQAKVNDILSNAGFQFMPCEERISGAKLSRELSRVVQNWKIVLLSKWQDQTSKEIVYLETLLFNSYALLVSNQHMSHCFVMKAI